MSRINPLARELVAKIVYYGPGLSGKTTSLKHVHRSLPEARRGEFVSLSTETDRTIFFDFLPVRLTQVGNMSVRLALYTVPGQVFYGATRKLVLNGADGVVFVADSQRSAMDANKTSLDDLEENLADMGMSLARFPHVLQLNKRDLPGVMPASEMARELNRHGAQVFESAATRGVGVMSALKAITQLVIRSLKSSQAAGRGNESVVEIAPDAKGGGLRDVVLEAAESGTIPIMPASAAVRSSSGGISFAPLWPEGESVTVSVVESAIASGDYALAVTTAAEMLAEVLEGIPGIPQENGPLARAMVLGVDGREYLKLCRMASAPGETLTVKDALFALYMLVGAQLKLKSV